eukprot:TRINITY_DN5708_c0_g3_i2.p1 TRINITY_DN5708_c0_g3~~TRINITY_DN5708_c0_g3_i2.p1  ORF type:complete len:148 (+),score=20.23 TRINITY_DN5708_c0_g3_i2:684-1127(+)
MPLPCLPSLYPHRYSRSFSTSSPPDDNNANSASVTYVNKDGTRTTCSGMYGENLMTIAHRNGIEMEGACEGSCACSTCHVIVSRDYYDKLPEATEEEDDMLDLAFGLTDTSRLGCQITLAPELDGIVVALPPATRNMAVDGHVAKPH